MKPTVFAAAAALSLLLLAGQGAAQQDLPTGAKLKAREAFGAFDQVVNDSAMSPMLQAIRENNPDQFSVLREDFVRTAQNDGVRVAVRGISGALSLSVANVRPRLANAPDKELNALLWQQVDTLRTLREESPEACVAFTETMTPPGAFSPSEAAGTKIFQTMALAVSAAGAARGVPQIAPMTPDDLKLISPDAENARIYSNDTPAGRCQGYVTLFGVVAAQPPARAARMYRVLLRDSFAPAKEQPPSVPVVSTPLRN